MILDPSHFKGREGELGGAGLLVNGRVTDFSQLSQETDLSFETYRASFSWRSLEEEAALQFHRGVFFLFSFCL